MEKRWHSREEFLRLVHMDGDGLVPGRVVVNGTIWDENEEYLKEVSEEAPHVEVSVARDPQRARENWVRDAWGCLWHYPGGYLDGQVVEHPLEDWSSWREYSPPDPEDFTDWGKAGEDVKRAKDEGKVAWGHVEHGFLYLRLTYLRGFQNFMLDVGEGRKELRELIDMVTDYWCEVVRRWLELGVDAIYFGDDLGHQDSLPISPESWRKLIKPAYRRIFSLCREGGVEVYLHTDGYVVDIIPDLLEVGVTILNPQDLVNGLEELRKLAWGKVCIDLDIDRQRITPFGTPEQIDEHILRCVRTLGSPMGGLMLIYGAYPGTPAENVAAVISAMERYHDWWRCGGTRRG